MRGGLRREWAVIRRSLPQIVIAAAIIAVTLLNFAYTSWSLHSELTKSCGLIEAQAASSYYPPYLRHDFAALARQRGC